MVEPNVSAVCNTSIPFTTWTLLYHVFPAAYTLPTIIFYLVIIYVLYKRKRTAIFNIFAVQCSMDVLLCLCSAVQHHLFRIVAFCPFLHSISQKSHYFLVVVPFLTAFSTICHYLCTAILSVNRMTLLVYTMQARQWWSTNTNRLLIWVIGITAVVCAAFCVFGSEFDIFSGTIYYQVVPIFTVNSFDVSIEDMVNSVGAFSFIVMFVSCSISVFRISTYDKNIMKGTERQMYLLCFILIVVNIVFLILIVTLYILLIRAVYEFKNGLEDFDWDDGSSFITIFYKSEGFMLNFLASSTLWTVILTLPSLRKDCLQLLFCRKHMICVKTIC